MPKITDAVCHHRGDDGTQCPMPVKWGVFDTHRPGRPNRFACDAHLHTAIDPERGGLVVCAPYFGT